MIKLDRMELEDCFSPADLVNEIYRQCPDLTPPIPINDIAYALGIIEILPISSTNFEGMLVTDDGKNDGVIFYNPEKPLGRQRFTIGHELGHYLLLHHAGNQTCTSSDISLASNSRENQKLENEANYFSQLLLFPESLIKLAIDDKIPDLELIQNISKSFLMSFEATANKCADYGKVPFALIYSKDGEVRYCWRNKSIFPYSLLVTKKSQMPVNSQAIRLNQKEQTISLVKKVSPLTWLSPNPELELPNHLFEQVYTQKNGYQVTLLRINQ